MDPDAAFLPKPSSDYVIPIYDAASFPDKQYITGMHFFAYASPYALFLSAKTESRRWVRFSVNMGFNINPHDFLPVMKVDLMDIGISVEVKRVQALDTYANIVFLGAPQNINKEYAKEVMDLHLKPLEIELMQVDATTYPPEFHSLPWPEYSVTCNQPGGLFEPPAKGMARTPPPRERRSLQLVCAKHKYQRLASLICAAKGKGVWTSEFGQGACYPVEVVTPDSTKVKKDHYRDMVETHASAQLGMAHETLSGVKDDRVEMSIRRLPDARGNREPMSISLWYVLRKMRFMDQPWWLCLVRTDKRQGFDVYFNGLCPITTNYVHEFLKCPAAQIMFWLLKRGFVKADVEAFLSRTFSIAQLMLCPAAKYNAEIKLAQVKTQSGDMDIVSASRRRNTFINPDLGLSVERIAIRRAQLEATVCNLGKYDFTCPQDLRSLHGNGSVAEWSTDGSMGASIYRINTPDTAIDVEDEEESNDNESEGEAEGLVGPPESSSPRVRFNMVLPSGETSDRLILPANRQGVSSLRHRDKAMDVNEPATEQTQVVSYRQFATSLWSVAPDEYNVLFSVLDTLEHKFVRSIGGNPLDIELDLSVAHLIQDDLRQKMVDAADGYPIAFIDEMRLLLGELQALDAEAQEIIDGIFRSVDDTEYFVDANEKVDDMSVQDRVNAQGTPPARLLIPARGAMQIEGLGDGIEPPQGSLLPAPVVAETATGDVETAHPGGLPG